jgi:hypothetical protein
MLTPKQKKARLGKITGSVMNTIMNGGMRAWCTLLDQKKRELEEPEAVMAEFKEINAPSLDWGNKYEPIAIANYELIYDVDVVVPEVSIIHPSIDFIASLPDFITDDVVGETKSPYDQNVHAMTVLHGMGVDTYKAQIQCEIACTEKDGCHFLSFDPRYPDPDKQLIVIEVERDEDYIEKMEEKCTEFWNYLQTDTRPECKIAGLNVIPELF